MQIYIYALAFITVATLGYCSLVPGWLRPRSGLSGNTEHMLAYFVAAMLVVTVFSSAYVAALLVLITLAAAFETGQRWIPGRTAAVPHFLWSCGGILAGAAFMKGVVAVGRHI